jgi:hypothetical protein
MDTAVTVHEVMARQHAGCVGVSHGWSAAASEAASATAATARWS